MFINVKYIFPIIYTRETLNGTIYSLIFYLYMKPVKLIILMYNIYDFT